MSLNENGLLRPQGLFGILPSAIRPVEREQGFGAAGAACDRLQRPDREEIGRWQEDCRGPGNAR